MKKAVLTALNLKPHPDFVETPEIREIIERAKGYLSAGCPVHFSGPAGTGKTTIAMHLASELGRPVTLVHGDDEAGTSDLVGDNNGYQRRSVVDNYIHSVTKTEEFARKLWVDSRLTTACKHGLTLVYDEFTRSRPEANNVLLSVLEERVLDLPGGHSGDPYLKVHPDFRAIFTSNPEEYVGVHKSQDALLDRMITVRIEHFGPEAEMAIVASKSGLGEEAARRVVHLSHALRAQTGHPNRPSLRKTIMLARLMHGLGDAARVGSQRFVDMCLEVLGGGLDEGALKRLGCSRDVIEDCIREAFRWPTLVPTERRDLLRRAPATAPEEVAS